MKTGDRVGGHFEVLERLGAGGMGEVWKARDTRLNRLVAIKQLHQQSERFEREARAVAALNHPHICAIYDVGENYFVMEYVDGAPLPRPMPLNEALRVTAQVADALASAHAAGITHRDLKPDNLLLTKSGQVKVLDFGLAKLNEPAPAAEEETRTLGITSEGTIVGTAAYMSPEQAEGKAVGARSDIFSLGAVLYELLTGRRAFAGDSRMGVLAAVLRSEPAPLGEAVPPEVAKLVGRMLRKDPEKRIQSMADVKLMLEELREESASAPLPAPVPVPGPGAASGTGLASPRPPWLVPAGLAALAAVAAGVYFARSTSPAATVPSSAGALAPTLVQVTSYPGIEKTPALSPDGRQVAFAWDGDREGGTFDLYLKLVDAGTPVRLTTHAANDILPAWSPDGNYLAFCRDGAEAGVYVIPSLGGNERRVVSLGAASNRLAPISGVEWSADGRSLLYVDQSQEPWAVRSISLDGTQPATVTQPPAGNWGDTDMVLSPDGKRLAFLRIRSPGEITKLVLDLGQAGSRPVLAIPGTINQHLTWMPDSQAIVHNALSGGLEWTPLSGGPSVRIDAAGPDAQHPRMARAAPRLAFTRAFADTNIWRLGLPPATSAPVRVIASSRQDGLPDQTSADGRIVFTSSRGGTTQVWIADADGANPVQLTTDAVLPAAPRLSPDGRWVAYAARPQSNVDVYVMDSRGGSTRRITDDAGEQHSARFSRDSQFLYYCANNSGRREVWKRRLEGSGAAQQVTRNGGWVSRESVDGQWLYFTKDGDPAIFRMPVAGGPEEVVVPKSSFAQWDVGEQGVYFADDQDLRFFRFADRKTLLLRKVPQLAGRVTGLALAADGRSLLYTQVDSQVSDIMMLDRFLGFGR